MLVTSYPVNCVTSSVAEHRQTLDIETTLTETFLPSLASDQGDTSAAAAPGQDLFSAHFEADIQRALAEAESGKESGPEEAAWWRGEEQRAADTTQPGLAAADAGKCWSESSSSSSQLAAAHRVTFSSTNEVAREARDGTFTVTYSQLGERISSKVPGLRVQLGHTSCLETVDLPPRLAETHARNVTFDEDSLLSYRSSSKATEEWDNPFQPEGEVSQDAELMLEQWKGGKLATGLGLDTAEHSAEELTDSTSEESEEADPGTAVTSSPDTGTRRPVINTADMNYIVIMNSDKEKHKNKIKKHCNLM